VLACSEACCIDCAREVERHGCQRFSVAEGLYDLSIKGDVKVDFTSVELYTSQVIGLERELEIITDSQILGAVQVVGAQDVVREVIVLTDALQTQVTGGVHAIVHPFAVLEV
jgi:hypothetical protein